MQKDYQSTLFKGLTTLQRDLNEKRINQQQFNWLVGFLLSTELGKFVKQEVADMLPENDNMYNMTLISYEINRSFHNAGR